jgi:GTP-binding protein YchF
LRVGLVGFSGAGKSTVFAALTGAPGNPGKGGLATIHVPDARVDRLVEIWSPKKVTYAEIVFEDYPAGAFGTGTGAISAQALGDMRNLDVLAEVVDAYSNDGDAAEVARLANAFHGELLLSDLAIIEKRLDRLTREKGEAGERECLELCRDTLEADRELRSLELGAQQLALLAAYRFLTLKPRILVVNLAEDRAAADPLEYADAVAQTGIEAVCMSAPLEAELAGLSEEERAEFLTDLGLTTGARGRFVAVCYSMLDLITFLTAGEPEVRAWPIRRGTKAVDAAGKIHSDIARGFIRAEVIAYDDYVGLGGEAACRQAGKLKQQGKDYIMADGDVVHFRFNV